MAGRDHDAETAAAQHVVAVVGGEYDIHDTGSEAGQYDVDIKSGEGVSIALEATSFGGDDWKQTGARVRKQLASGAFAGDGLERQWLVVFPSGIGVRELEAPVTEVLLRLEREGKDGATNSYGGDDATLREVAEALRAIRVNSVFVFDHEPPANEPRIFPAQSERSVGGAGALPAALTALFQKRDNQEKLARSKADERHLYVFMEDGGASAVLEGMWPLPASPEDPAGVIDTLWVYCPSASSYLLFRNRPGTDEWERFNTVTGEPSNP
jgi:hypothetical protein